MSASDSDVADDSYVPELEVEGWLASGPDVFVALDTVDTRSPGPEVAADLSAVPPPQPEAITMVNRQMER